MNQHAEAPDASSDPSPVGPAVIARPVKMEPLRPQARIETIDVLRGFAIFGILLVNMGFFGQPFTELISGGGERWPEVWNRLTHLFVAFFGDSKFYSLFSLLFGLGFAIQMSRAQAKGRGFGWFFTRRLLVLLLIGQAHAILIWNGDILTIYAVLGFILLLFRNRRPRTLIIWAVVFLSLPVLFQGAMTALYELGQAIPEAREGMKDSMAEHEAGLDEHTVEALTVYGGGTYPEILEFRVEELLVFYTFLPFTVMPSALAMFLVGLYVGKRGIHLDVEAHLPFVRRVMWWGLGLGVAGNLGYVLASREIEGITPNLVTLAATVGLGIGAPALCLFYASGLTLLHRRPEGRWLSPLAAVGRMALTNYLLQSVVCTLIFYGYGLGLYGSVSPVEGLGLTVLIYALQAPLSVWWLSRFQYGPMEWFWRTCTYGRLQPMRRVE